MGLNLCYGVGTFGSLFSLGCAFMLLARGWPLSAVTMAALALGVALLTWRVMR